MTTRAIIILSIVSAILLLLARASVPTSAWSEKIDGKLLAATAGGATAEFLVVLDEQANLSDTATIADKVERGRAVYEILTATAARTQQPIRTMLDAHRTSYRPYWVMNMIRVRGDRALALALASRADVNHIYANTWQQVQLPITDAAPVASRDFATVEWNIALVKAPHVWAEGFNGQGAVIGGQDTGYDWEHQALIDQYRGWDGATADHAYNWHDAIHEDLPENGPGNSCGFNLPEPCDDNGHGTHTMGTMVGESDIDKIGMAPGAKWIGCRNMENNWGSPSTYAECYEWFIAPYPFDGDPFTDGDPAKAPHIINNSWSCPVAEGCAAPEILQAVVETVRAAGILTVHSAGNSGSSCGSVATPAAIYDASFTVGATESDDSIAQFSSRGPVTIDGSDRRKPDIVAPGSGVYSSIPGGWYAMLSGTSMAGPHVAGLAALLISADPALAGQVDELERIITESALPLTSDQNCGTDTPTSVPNNVYGWGRIDALAAFAMLEVDSDRYEWLLPAVLNQWP